MINIQEIKQQQEREVATKLFDVFQESVNFESNHYCTHFDHLEKRLQKAWLEVAKELLKVETK